MNRESGIKLVLKFSHTAHVLQVKTISQSSAKGSALERWNQGISTSFPTPLGDVPPFLQRPGKKHLWEHLLPSLKCPKNCIDRLYKFSGTLGSLLVKVDTKAQFLQRRTIKLKKNTIRVHIAVHLCVCCAGSSMDDYVHTQVEAAYFSTPCCRMAAFVVKGHFCILIQKPSAQNSNGSHSDRAGIKLIDKMLESNQSLAIIKFLHHCLSNL